MDCAETPGAGGDQRARLRLGGWLTSLLPNEPRILHLDLQAALTARYILPVLSELEVCLLAVRQLLDPELEQLQPMKLGKPYPVGQCLEIAEAVQKRLRTVEETSLPEESALGLRALREFQRAGGDFRQVWGDLRGQYFQNAFQVGTLYIDVANDTVIPTKPKVEILRFDQARFVPVRDHRHFSQVARSYWQHEVYPNHVLPVLAPHCPLIHVDQSGQFHVHEATQYMLALTRAHAFAPSEDMLRDTPMPTTVFERISRALQGAGFTLPRSPEHGRQLALQNCRQFRAKRWHRDPKLVPQVIQQVNRINQHLAHSQHQTPSDQFFQDKPMPSLTIDNIDYDLDTLSAEAKAQLQSIQFVDQELARLQAQMAVMQTARNAYLSALKAALASDG
jgi:hypothetical protein